MHFPALAAAVIIALAADMAMPVRRIGSWMITLGAAGTLVAGLASPFGTVAGLVVGLAAAACARLAFGTSAGQPSVDEISDGLAALGAPVSNLHPIARQRTGVFTLLGVDRQQRNVIVRVYGRDAYDNQLLAGCGGQRFTATLDVGRNQPRNGSRTRGVGDASC